jgi:hypothetical protein
VALPRRRLLASVLLSTATWATHVVPADEPGSLSGVELALAPSALPPLTDEPDVVVYGGTPAGVAAAIGAADHGADVTLLAEGTTVGGMMSNGISASDVGSEAAVDGVALQFFDRVRGYYRDPSTWRFEPRIAERVLRRMLDEAAVDVRLEQPLRGVTTEGRRITCLEVPDGDVCGSNVVDASYTGEVIAAADVPHRLGLGDLEAYGEYMAERRDWISVLRVPDDQVAAATAAFEENPFVRVEDELPAFGDAVADGAPSLTYRLCVTDDATNRTEFRPVPGYAELLPSFRVMARRVADDVQLKPNGTMMSDLFHLARLPGGKYDLNAGRLSYTNVPAPEGYFESVAQRGHANRTLENYVRSFFYFVRIDPAVPPSVQKAFRPFGLCADEFTDNEGWPSEPYVREGRRIVGRATLTVADLFVRREKSDAVAVGSYHVDGKLSQVVFADGVLHRDLGVHTSAPVYEIPFAAMVPQRGSVTNLLAPVGLSASPTAYGSVRMEPQYMALGQAAGVAAALAARKDLSVAALPPARVQAALRYDGVVHTARGVCERTAPALRSAGGFTAGCALAPFEQD